MACRIPLARTPRHAFRASRTAPRQPRARYSTAPTPGVPLSEMQIPAVPFQFEKPTMNDVQVALDFMRNRTLVTPDMGSGFALSDPLWLPGNVTLLAWPLFRCFANYDSWFVPSTSTERDFSLFGLLGPRKEKGLHLFSSEDRYKKWLTDNKNSDIPSVITPSKMSGARFLTAVGQMPDLGYIELDPGSLRHPLAATSVQFPTLKKLTLAYQNEISIRRWKDTKKPATLMYNLGTRSPFFALLDRAYGQFLRIQDDEAYLPVFTDLYYFMRWYEVLPATDREGLELSAMGGFKTWSAALGFMDKGWASSVVVNPGTPIEHRVSRAEWREMTSLMRNEAQVRAEKSKQRAVPDPAADEYEVGSIDQNSPVNR